MTIQRAQLGSDEYQSLLTRSPDSRPQLLDLVDEHTPAGRHFNAAMMALILCNVVLFFATTTEPFYRQHQWELEAFEFLSVVVFAAEYAVRLYVAPEKNAALSPTQARLKFAFSFYGAVDLVGWLPYFLTLLVPSRHLSLAVVRVVRLLRLFRAEGQYFEAFTLFDDVFRNNRTMLKVTSFTGFVVWLFIAAFNYLAERSNESIDGKMSTYFGALWWTLVNLNGEFPLNAELTPWGKVIACGTMVVAVGIFAIPTGILGAGLKEIYDQRRADAAEEAESADPGAPAEVCTPCTEERLRSAPLKERIWYHMEGHSTLGKNIDRVMLVLILLNVAAIVLSTVPKFPHKAWLTLFEGLSIQVFTVEFALNVYSCVADPRFSGPRGRLRFAMSFYGLVDLAAILPWWVDRLYPGDFVPTSFLRVLRLIKLMRADIETFSLFGEVLRLKRDLFLTAGFVGLVLWVCFASLMHFTERDNPDPEVRAEYQSGAGAAWMVLLNLTGEYPFGDYTLLGRCLSFVSCICAIGVFAIPTGLFADGFEQILSERAEAAERRAKDPPKCAVCHRNVDEVNGVTPAISMDEAVEVAVREEEAEVVVVEDLPSTPRGRLFRLLNADTEAGERLDLALMALIAFNILCFIVSTESSVMKAYPGLRLVFRISEWVTMVLFTAEYSLRVWTSPENPKFQRSGRCWGNPYLQHIFSFYALIDLMAILPFWVDELLPAVEIAPTTIFRIFRLIGLLKGEKYAPAFTLLDDVFAAKRLILACAGVVAAILVVVFATLLHYSESQNETEVSGLTMAQRYVDVPHALFYAMLHLTGDYPLYQYTFWGRVINFAMIVIAAGLVGILTGAIAGGFQDMVEGTRKAKEGEQKETLEVQTGFFDKFCRPCRVQEAKKRGFRAQVYTFLQGDTLAGGLFIKLLLVVIVLNILTFAIKTDRPLARAVGTDTLELLEGLSALLFTVEYALRIYAAPEDPDYSSRWQYATSFLALVDLGAVLPFYISLAFGKVAGWSMVLRSFRMIRLLKVEHYMEAFTILDNVLARAQRLLVTTGLAAIIIWVGSATLFWALESSNPLAEGKFDSIPSALFYTILFLGGEWAFCDFTVWGQLVGVVLCVAGIGLFAVPTGILYSGFEELLAKQREQREAWRAGAQCEGCGGPIRHLLHHRTQDG